MKLSDLYSTLYDMGIPNLRVFLDPVFVDGKDGVEVDAGPRIGIFGLFTPSDWVTLSAASDDTPVPVQSGKQRSVFTESLVEGLKGSADTSGEGDSDGTVTAEELYAFTKDKAEAAAEGGDKTPVPSFYGSSEEPLRTY